MRYLPLSDMERSCIKMRSRGRTTQEIQAILCISRRSVTDYLQRATLKLGARTLEEAVSIFTQAQVLRSIADSIHRLGDMDDVAAWQEGLRRYAEDLDRTTQPDCLHGRQLIEQFCQQCLDTKPGSHHYKPVRLFNAATARPAYRCFVCGRPKKAHGRDKSLEALT